MCKLHNRCWMLLKVFTRPVWIDLGIPEYYTRQENPGQLYEMACYQVRPKRIVRTVSRRRKNIREGICPFHWIGERLMCNSCHIRHLMKCPNWCRTWNICFLLIFSWKMLQPNFAFWDIFMLLTCLNSKEIKLQSSIRVICIIFDLIFFSWKLKT